MPFLWTLRTANIEACLRSTGRPRFEMRLRSLRMPLERSTSDSQIRRCA